MNQKIGLWISLALVLCLISPSTSLAQRGKGAWGGWGPGSRYGGMYNPQAVESVQGVIDRVERFSSGKGMSSGVRLIVKTETETLPVMLGPIWFIEQQALKLAVGDWVEITGSRGTAQDQTILIAGEVKKGKLALRLRDSEGMPLWARQRWRQR